MIVRCLAFHRMFLLICFLTAAFHFARSFPLCACINSKSVMCIYLSVYFQYLMVGVYISFAFLKIWLCKVFSYITVFPIMTSVFLKFSCVSFLIPSSISVASFAPYIGDLSIALIALLFEILYFS